MPSGTPQRIGSALKSISNPRTTSSHGLDNSPLPLNLSGSSAKRPISVGNDDDDDVANFFSKRPTTAQTSVASSDDLTSIWPNIPYIVSNEIKAGDRLQCVFALVVADQTMVLSETIAQTFGMLLLKVREKTGVEVSLETITKAAGIDTSFVLKMDMTLCLPMCASLPRNCIKDKDSFAVFSGDDAARKLAQQTLNLLKERSWRLNSRLENKYKRTSTNAAETFIPVRFVADKLTHLGRPWKPVTIDSHERRVPQTITPKWPNLWIGMISTRSDSRPKWQNDLGRLPEHKFPLEFWCNYRQIQD